MPWSATPVRDILDNPVGQIIAFGGPNAHSGSVRRPEALRGTGWGQPRLDRCVRAMRAGLDSVRGSLAHSAGLRTGGKAAHLPRPSVSDAVLSESV